MPETWQEIEIGNKAQIVSATAAILSFLIACAALVFVWFQIANNREISREATARQIFRQHLELGIRNPSLSLPDIQAIEERGSKGTAQYGHFVTHLLFTCEEILAAFPGDKGWEDGC